MMATIGIDPLAPEGDADREPTGEALTAAYEGVRAFTGRLTVDLAPEDMVVQSMPEVSPTRRHLANTSWFFECFVLIEHLRDPGRGGGP